MKSTFKFLASGAGRVVRVVAGAALIAWALSGLSGTTSIIVAIVGLVPLAAGLFDVCVFSPLFGGPFKGSELRAS